MPTAEPAAAAAAADGAERGAAVGSRTALRRAQRRATAASLRARLAQLEANADGESSSGESFALVSEASLADELARRLELLAPALVAGLSGISLDALQRRRRNAAAHCFEVPAAQIAVAGGTELNRLQRGLASSGSRREAGEQVGRSTPSEQAEEEAVAPPPPSRTQELEVQPQPCAAHVPPSTSPAAEGEKQEGKLAELVQVVRSLQVRIEELEFAGQQHACMRDRLELLEQAAEPDVLDVWFSEGVQTAAGEQLRAASHALAAENNRLDQLNDQLQSHDKKIELVLDGLQLVLSKVRVPPTFQVFNPQFFPDKEVPEQSEQVRRHQLIGEREQRAAAVAGCTSEQGDRTAMSVHGLQHLLEPRRRAQRGPRLQVAAAALLSFAVAFLVCLAAGMDYLAASKCTHSSQHSAEEQFVPGLFEDEAFFTEQFVNFKGVAFDEYEDLAQHVCRWPTS
jgi:hypothetical protein